MQFRQLELANALSAIIGVDGDIPLIFDDALQYDGEDDTMSDYHVDAFQGAMQFLDIEKPITELSSNQKTLNSISSELLKDATKRCSLIRASYEIISEADEYEELASLALSSGLLSDFLIGNKYQKASWRLRLRQYGSMSNNGKEKRYGKNMRSPLSQERNAVNQMKELFINFGGDVSLKNPDCSLYVFEGLKNRKKILAKLITKGPNISLIAPKTRICVTNTPLCPIAAYNMCNLARVKPNDKILDPFAGSCTVLLATAMISPSCQTVGIEIAHNGIVNRDNIIKDFETRNLTSPAAIIRGDCTNATVRDMARDAVDNMGFDLIITDPPYGIRERSGGGCSEDAPLDQLCKVIRDDRIEGKRLLKKGGRLIAFVPNVSGENINDALPDRELLKGAGLDILEMREQPLNDALSRWLVSFNCIL